MTTKGRPSAGIARRTLLQRAGIGGLAALTGTTHRVWAASDAVYDVVVIGAGISARDLQKAGSSASSCSKRAIASAAAR